MERKLLSLPSFFVLLLIAGIAFLATPVVEVQAQAPMIGASNITVATIGDDDTEAVFTIQMSRAVKVTLPDGTNAATGFGREDLLVTRTITNPPAEAVTGSAVPAGQWVLAAVPMATTGQPDAANKHFTVTVDIPANSDGSITVATAADAMFQEAGAGTGAYTPTGTDTRTSPTFTRYDGTKPTVGIALDVAGPKGLAPFLVTFTFTDTGFDEDGPTFALGSINVTGGMATELGDLSGTASPYTVKAYVQAADDVSEVIIGVAANAVMDASGNGNDAIAHERTDDTPPAVPAGALKVEVDTTEPFVDIATVTTPETPSADEVLTSIAVTFSVKEGSAAGDPTKTETLGSSAAREIAETEVTVEGGTISDIVAATGTFNAVFTATITRPATATSTEVKISVNENAVVDGAGNGNAASSKTISTGYVAATTPPPPTTSTGIGDPLSRDREGFSFELRSGVPANGFVVLAHSPSGAGFTAGAGDFSLASGTDLPVDATRIDINDERWVDLKLFLVTREGGTIDLIKQGNGAPVKSLVISEVMWGNDTGLGVGSENNSQWIELYNTTGAAITAGTWELEFTAKSRGRAMLTGTPAKAVATTAQLGGVTTASAPVVDKLSTWRDVGNYWDWRITDSAGGSHGQSGKSTANSAQSIGPPQELVSMQRKINYDNVVKTDHVSGDTPANRAANRNKQLEAVPGGVAAGNWEATQEHGAMLTRRKGTPGAAPTIKKVDKSGVPRGSVVFNEIANRVTDGDANNANKKYEWIELYNKSSSAKKINDWMLSVVTATGTDTPLITFTGDDDINVPAKGYLLVVNQDPRNTPLEGGYDVVNPGNSARQSDGAGNKPSRLYYVSNELVIPDKKFLLILRHGKDKIKTHEKVEDVAGNNPRFDDNAKSTQVWPLNSWSVGALDDLKADNSKTWNRYQDKAVFNGDEWKQDKGGFTGLGIDRDAGTGAYTSGTPGYNNDAVKGEVKSDGLTHANPVVISEIMFGSSSNRGAPQWIELYNPSHTQAVNIKDWKLEIFNYYGDETLVVDHHADLTLPERRIQPNQTILIVSRATSRTSDSDAFPDNRIIDVWAETALRNELNMQNQRDAILSTTGFYLKLSDLRKTEVDVVGNIDANRRSNDEPDWTLPGGSLENGGRSSMVRDLEGSASDGTEADAWRDATAVDSSKIQPDATELYYGDDDDVGTPGYTPGGVLPVQLSSFYSKRNDAGAVVITWSTESELDNAGFNILRSMSRTGEFTRINAQLIPGAGTTGEKNTYTWTDTSARPNVVYYYQIEDVSLEGEHRTLRTTRLRGHVGAAGKATVIWGELKSRK